jgi:lipoate-protein ligase A
VLAEKVKGKMSARRSIRLLRLNQVPIFYQLKIEEALFRIDTSSNWCVLNRGSSPAIVMGISGKINELVDTEAARRRNIPVIRRFTGGGTVIIDPGTVLVSLICNKDAVPEQPAFPRELMRWSENFYQPVFANLLSSSGTQTQGTLQRPMFTLQENDYCLADTKIGGNAQSISSLRWVHHTSFLWSFSAENMRLLTLPAKRPSYRHDRAHDAFLTSICTHVDRSKAATDEDGATLMHDAIEARLHEVFENVETVTLEEAQEILSRATQRQSSNEFVQY